MRDAILSWYGIAEENKISGIWIAARLKKGIFRLEIYRLVGRASDNAAHD